MAKTDKRCASIAVEFLDAILILIRCLPSVNYISKGSGMGDRQGPRAYRGIALVRDPRQKMLKF
jgi:hypothetical protein